MSSPRTAIPVPSSASAQPVVVFVQDNEQRMFTLGPDPFTVGRKPDKHLVIADPRVSRNHAEIVKVGAEYFVVDLQSKHGTFLNGKQVERHKLTRNDHLEFGMRMGPHLLFHPTGHTSAARDFLSQISSISVPGSASDLEKLTLFLEGARKLNTTGAVDEILLTLIDTTLRLTGAERGYVFLREKDGSLSLAAAQTSTGEKITEAGNISRSILEEAARSASEFLVTDTLKSSTISARESIVMHDIRSVICIPLRKTSMNQKINPNEATHQPTQILGILYLDSRLASGTISTVSHDILSAIATEAAALVENAYLARSEEASRRYQQELDIAASIQQRLMAVTIPDLPYVKITARNMPCKDVGGDFYDVVQTDEGTAVVVADVSGKGISSALLASILQGMIYSQLLAHVALVDVVAAANRFICEKQIGGKYATLVILRLCPDGNMEYVNCGHIYPALINAKGVTRIVESNVPVGLLPNMTYVGGKIKMNQDDRLVLVTDGVTEAEDNTGEFFGEDGLDNSLRAGATFEGIFAALRQFCGDCPMNDDCTVLEIHYRADGAPVN